MYPVMLIHGMCCTGEVWSNYRQFFEDRGHRVYTPTLRPELRVRRAPPKALGKLRVQDYVEELIAAFDAIVAETAQVPVAIGHSMGGLLVQILAQQRPLKAAVAVSPTPLPMVSPGRLSFITRLAHLGITSKIGPHAIVPHPRMANRLVFNRVDPAERHAYWKAMVHESVSVFADFRNAHLDPVQTECPVLVVGCGRDRLVPALWTRRTGAAYTQANSKHAYREYAPFGHWFYAEPNWQEPAHDIAQWIDLTARQDQASPEGD